MLAVTGATGEVGRRVAERLASRGIAQRLIVREPQRAPKLPGAEVVQASSYGDAAAMGRALTGVDKLFMVSAQDLMGFIRRCVINKVPISRYDRLQQHVALVAAAAAVGVQHIVYLSFVSAAEDATFILAHEHFLTEEYIRSSGFPFTFLRQSLYMDNAAAHASDDGIIRIPVDSNFVRTQRPIGNLSPGDCGQSFGSLHHRNCFGSGQIIGASFVPVAGQRGYSNIGYIVARYP